MAKLTLDDNLVYQITTNGIPFDDTDKIRLDKNRLDKISIDKNSKGFDDELKEIFGDEDV